MYASGIYERQRMTQLAIFIIRNYRRKLSNFSNLYQLSMRIVIIAQNGRCVRDKAKRKL